MDLNVTAARWGPRPAAAHHGFGSRRSPPAHVYCPQSRERKDINMSREQERKKRRRRRRAGMRPADETVLAPWDEAAAVIKEKWSKGLPRFFDSGKSRLTRCRTHAETHSNFIHLWSATQLLQTITAMCFSSRPPLVFAQWWRKTSDPLLNWKYQYRSGKILHDE